MQDKGEFGVVLKPRARRHGRDLWRRPASKWRRYRGKAAVSQRLPGVAVEDVFSVAPRVVRFPAGKRTDDVGHRVVCQSFGLMDALGDELEKRLLFRRRKCIHGGFDFGKRAYGIILARNAGRRQARQRLSPSAFVIHPVPEPVISAE